MDASIIATLKSAVGIYEYLCQPICKEFDIQQPALDILLFLHSNPKMDTAVDIQKSGNIKQSMVSFHVEKLVQGGYLERQSVPGDRRKIRLVCTEKADPVLRRGNEARQKYMQFFAERMSQEDRDASQKFLESFQRAVASLNEKMRNGELN